MTLNEARRELGLLPLDGGDVELEWSTEDPRENQPCESEAEHNSRGEKKRGG